MMSSVDRKGSRSSLERGLLGLGLGERRVGWCWLLQAGRGGECCEDGNVEVTSAGD